MKEKNKAVFLDRDGTLNHDEGYVFKVEDFELLPGVIEGLKRLSEDFTLFIITNQPGIGKNYYTEEDLHKFNRRLEEELGKEGIEIKKIYFCPHTSEDNCDCRKPNTKNIKKAKEEFDIDLSRSWMIGDHPSDALLGIRAGCRTVYLLTGHGRNHADQLAEKGIEPEFIANNFIEAAEYIVENSE